MPSTSNRLVALLALFLAGGAVFLTGGALLTTTTILQPRALHAQSLAELSDRTRGFVASEASHFLIRNVTLIDGTGAPARTGMSVEVRDGRIARVGPAAELQAAPGAEVIDGSGGTLIPGLVMLHEHMFYPSGQGRYNTNEVSFPTLYLAGGATTIRTGGSLDPYSDLRTAQLIAEGAIPGPDMDVTGPYLEGPGGFIRAFPQLATPEEARAHVNFWMDRGVTSFKAYNRIDRATLGAAIEAAHARGAKVTGHLCSITYREAADLGIDNLEHGFFAATDWVEGKEPDQCVGGANPTYLALDLEGRAFLDVVDHLIERGVALTSTLNVVERRGGGRPHPPEGALDAILPQLREGIERRLGVAPVAPSGQTDAPGGADAPTQSARPGQVARPGPTSPSGPFETPELLRRYMDMEKAFHDRGGFLVAGTDPTGGGDVVPGYANQRAIQLLVEMGLGVEEAVMVATRNGAIYLERQDEVGTIEAGKRADLVLMDGDLTADLGAIRRMRIVFKQGVAYDSPRLFEAVSGWVGVR